MAVVVWITIAMAIWHFTIFLPDRFWGGIVGAFLGAVLGACVTGAIWQIAQGDSLGTTDLITLLAAVPGCLAGLAVVYQVGVREEENSTPLA